ncbi:MAG: cysteine desulfurase-like protein [Bacteroidetes bacterium]|nr:cysteine desulfurase-like protein [Bacteroidota bacterium]
MYSVQEFRKHFPSLKRVYQNKPLTFLDGPGGTQVPSQVTDAITHYYHQSNSNTHGVFITTRETDETIESMRKSMSVFLGAEHPNTISVGQNMTTLNFALARGMGRIFQPGDEILITQLDHEGNRGPWLSLRERGIIIKEVRLKPDGRLDYEDMERKLSERTRLLAMGMASNAIGTVNDIETARKLTYKTGTWLLLDAVHYAPHFSIDVCKIGCDFLLCSAYKFYGPHVGILYSRPGLLDNIPTDHLRTAGQTAPDKIETGTLNHAALAGVDAAAQFLWSFGEGENERSRLINAYGHIGTHERKLAEKLYSGLSSTPGVKVIGTDFNSGLRAPTVSFVHNRLTAEEVCKKLATENICAWDGHFYAQRAIEVLGLLEGGGVTRLGLSAYNTEEEIANTLKAIEKL